MRFNRKHLTVLTVAGLAGATMFASAAWTASAQGSQHVKSAKMGVSVNGSGSATFSQSTSDFIPGEKQVTSFSVLNTGTIAETLTATASSSDPCFTASVLLPQGVATDTDDQANDYDPSEGGTGTLTISVGADNACQDKQADVTVSVLAAQSASPRG